MTTTLLNTKIGEIENKIPDSSDLVTTTIFNKKIVEAENKIPDVSSLVKKTDYNTKISNIATKYFTTSDYSKFTSQMLEMKMKKRINLIFLDLYITLIR